MSNKVSCGNCKYHYPIPCLLEKDDPECPYVRCGITGKVKTKGNSCRKGKTEMTFKFEGILVIDEFDENSTDEIAEAIENCTGGNVDILTMFRLNEEDKQC